METIYFI